LICSKVVKPWLTALSLSGLGFYIAGAIILGIVGGRWVDSKLNTNPLWLIIGLILGIVVAVTGTYNMLKPFLENNKKDKGNK
jgi:ATP synthase protein I